jgi:hypothetical protein
MAERCDDWILEMRAGKGKPGAAPKEEPRPKNHRAARRATDPIIRSYYESNGRAETERLVAEAARILQESGEVDRTRERIQHLQDSLDRIHVEMEREERRRIQLRDQARALREQQREARLGMLKWTFMGLIILGVVVCVMGASWSIAHSTPAVVPTKPDPCKVLHQRGPETTVCTRVCKGGSMEQVTCGE